MDSNAGREVVKLLKQKPASPETELQKKESKVLINSNAGHWVFLCVLHAFWYRPDLAQRICTWVQPPHHARAAGSGPPVSQHIAGGLAITKGPDGAEVHCIEFTSDVAEPASLPWETGPIVEPV
jgi:hypothetical protein